MGKKVKTNLISLFLISIGITLNITYFYIDYLKNEYEDKSVENYFKSINIDTSTIKSVPKAIKKQFIEYIAILEIPKINLKKGLVNPNTKYNNVNENIEILNPVKMPDEDGNMILASHSGSSRVAFFNNLYLLKNSDKVYIYYNKKKYEYKIIKKYETKKSGKLILPNNIGKKNLILTTCSKNKYKQLVVIASLIKETKI